MTRFNNYNHSILLVSLGTGLEYYDFVIYGVMAYYLSELFFPNVDSSISIIKSFSVFTVGYIARPVGSIIFGFLGDKFGRKSTFALSMLLITVSTLAISILPTYNTIGFKAIMLLVFFRIIQGISFAAELPGATTFINESSAPNKSGFYSGILMVSIGIGDITASFTVFLLTYLIGQKGIVEWGWRIPFFLGGVFAFISFYFRRNIYETPEFINYAKTGLNNKSIKDLYKEINWLLIVTGIAISLLGAFLLVFNLYLPVYLSKYFGYDLSSIYFFTLLGIIVATILLPVFGLISDKMGAINILLIHVLILPICSLLIFLFYTKEIIYPALLIFIYQITSYSFYTGFLVLLGRLFPVSIRYTSIAICYNIGYCLASLTPILLTYIIERNNNPFLPYWIITLMCMFTLIICLCLKYNIIVSNVAASSSKGIGSIKL